jgi:hypothetical protein
MATKAEKFKASAELNASIEHKKTSAKKGAKSIGGGEKETEGSIAQATKGTNAPARKRPQDKGNASDMPKKGADDRKAGGDSTADRNRSVRATKKASYELEDSATGTPSRKSTRRAENRAKPDSQLKRRQVRKTSSPQERAVRATTGKS